MEIQIKYNPYSLCTDVLERTKNGWEAYKGPWVTYIQGKQLQTWFRKDQNKNWAGFCAEVSTALNEDVTIFYEGRESDYKDLLALIDKDKFKVIAPEQFSLSDVEAIKKLTEIRDTIAQGDFSDSEEVQAAIANYDNMKNGWFDIAVVATMSSGKSTLINALMRGNYMPTGNMATTAKVVRIFNKDEQQHFSFKSYDKEGCLLSEGELTTPEAMNEMNSTENVFRIDITGNVPGISNTDFLNLRLIDTPGPNNSATDEHKEVAFSVIADKKNQPMILFVQDTTKLEETSEYTLLKEISDAMKESLQAQERFIFVMNRSDQIDAKKENVLDFVAKEKNYLSTKFGIDAPQIIPIAAQAAYLQSMSDIAERDGGELDEEELMGLNNFRMRLKNSARDLVGAADLSPSVRTALEKLKSSSTESTQTLLNSGITGLEFTIGEYLRKYAMPYKIYHCQRAMASQLKTLRAIHNYQKRISEDKVALEQSEKQQLEIQERLQDFILESQDFHDLASSVGIDGEWKKIIVKCTLQLMHVVNKSISIIPNYHLTNDDSGTGYLDRSDANAILRQADKHLRDAIAEMKQNMIDNLNLQLKNDFTPCYAKCKEIINEFIALFDKVEGLDANELHSFEDILECFNEAEEYSLESYINENPIKEWTATITTTHTRSIANPEKSGFWGMFKFWQPDTIRETYTEQKNYNNMILPSDIISSINKHVDNVQEMTQNDLMNEISNIYDRKREDLINRSQIMTETIQKESERLKNIIEDVKSKRVSIRDLEAKEQQAQIVDKLIIELNSLGNVA